MKRAILVGALFALGARAELFQSGYEGPERDDPRGRAHAREVVDGLRTVEAQIELLHEAEREARKYGLQPGVDRPVRATGTAWVNLGPTSADFERNAGTYFNVDSGRARKILVDPRNANVVYFATSGGGVWKTWDALAPITATTGPHWQAITDGIPYSLSVGSMAMNPVANDSLLLGLGDPFDVHTPGLLSSDDGGATWSNAVSLSGSYAGLSGAFTATSVRDLAFDPGGAIVLAATDAGLFRSTQGGVGPGWSLIDVDAVRHLFQDAWSVAYAGPHTWLLTSVDLLDTKAGHLWQSTDDGAHWVEKTSALNTTDVRRMTVATSGVRAYLLAANAQEVAQKDVFRSDDSGAAWASLRMSPGSRPPVNPTDDQRDLDFINQQAFYNQMIVADPVDPNVVFVGGDLAMGRSIDGGTTWTVMTDWLPFALSAGGKGGLGDAQYAHADWHTATIAHFGTSAYFYGGHDGGITRAVQTAGGGFLTSAPGSVPWEDKLNRGIVSHLINSVATGKERPSTRCNSTASTNDIVYGGFQDNGTRLRVQTAGSTTVFNQIVGGDGFGVGVGCTPGGVMGSNLISTFVSEISFSNDSGTSFIQRVKLAGTGLTPPIALDPNYTFVMRIAADYQADRTYITPLTDTSQAGHVYRSQDGGNTWNEINGTVHRLAPNVNGTQFPEPLLNAATHVGAAAGTYAVVSVARAYVTVDGGANWFETPKMAPSGGVNYLPLQTVAFEPGDTTGNTIWVGSKATRLSDGAALPLGATHLYRCTGAAGATPVCTAKGNLPKVPVNVVKVDPLDSQTVYVGTEIGLYRSTDGGTTFLRYGIGLPLVSVTDLAINADASALRVSTYGRGFWEINASAGAPVGVLGNGDFDGNQVVDGFDLVREAAAYLSDSSSPDYNAIGNLTGSTNVIDLADLNALIAKLGGRP